MEQQQELQQEEEWNREGVLDPAWERQQRKVGMLFVSVYVLLWFHPIDD